MSDAGEKLILESVGSKPKVIDGVQILKRLRSIVDPPGLKGTWLKHLNDRQLLEIYHRLNMGQPAYRIVKIVQQDWQLQRTSSIKSLTRAVRAFRDQAVGEIKAIAAGRGTKQELTVSKELEGKVKRVGGRINALAKLSWLIGIQEERVEMLYNKEKMSLPFKHTDGTVRTMLDLLREYVEMSIKLGVIDEMPKEFSVKVQHEFSKVLSTTVGTGGAKVVDALGRFLELAQEHSQKLVMDKEGVYVLEKEDGAEGSKTKK